MTNLKISNNYLHRIISGIVLIAVMSLGIVGSNFLFILISLVIFVFMLKEWVSITYPVKKDILVGFISIFLAIFSLLFIKLLTKYSDQKLLWYFITIWSFDSFAMLGGKLIGGSKLAPKISPMKNWSGFLCGLYASCLIVSILQECGLFYLYLSGSIFKMAIIIPTSLICIFAQASDLFESYYKRRYSVKDSGTIIPGHGGMLDRFDSIIFSAPLLVIMSMF